MIGLRNRFACYCCECGRWIPTGGGHLLGKDEPSGRWEVRWEACEAVAYRATKAAEDAAWQAAFAWRARQQADRDEQERQEALRRADADERLRRLIEETAALRAAAEAAAFRDRLDATLASWEAERTARSDVPPYLKTLGLVPPVDVPAIKGADRRLVLVHHPDKGGDPRRFVVVQEAYRQAMSMAGGAA